MKKGKTCHYFDGQLTDETANIRFVGFNSALRKKLFDYQAQNDAVALSHCQVQQSRKADLLELKLNTMTEVRKASKQFDVPDDMITTKGSLTQLSTIHELPEYTRITIEVKVTRVDDPMEIANGNRNKM